MDLLSLLTVMGDRNISLLEFEGSASVPRVSCLTLKV